MTGFQTTMNSQPAIGIEGDFCSTNPRFSLLASPGGLVAGPNGVSVGRFAWADGDGVVSYGGNGRIGFIHRSQLSLIFPTSLTGANAWPGPQTTMLVVPNAEMSMINSGDVFCRFAAGATVGQKVYANFADGTAVAAATGSPAGATSTGNTISAQTNSFTGGIQNGLLTVVGPVTGTIYPGTIISGTNVVAGTQIQEQVTPLLAGETTGGVGRYLVSIDDGQVVANGTAISGSYGLFTDTTHGTGTFALGDTLTGSSVAAGTTITAFGTGTGANNSGTYIVSPSGTTSTTTITAATDYETNWYVDSYAGAGELAMISTRG